MSLVSLVQLMYLMSLAYLMSLVYWMDVLDLREQIKDEFYHNSKTKYRGIVCEWDPSVRNIRPASRWDSDMFRSNKPAENCIVDAKSRKQCNRHKIYENNYRERIFHNCADKTDIKRRFDRRTVLIIGGIAIVSISVGAYTWMKQRSSEVVSPTETQTEISENITSDS